jgi:hypothetical protein
MKTITNRFLRFASVLTLVAAPLAAQAATVTRTSNYGLDIAGGSTTVTASASIVAPTAQNLMTTTINAGTNTVSNVRLFGFTAQAASLSASYSCRQRAVFVANGLQFQLQFQRSSFATFSIRIAGNEVLSDTATNEAQSASFADDVFLSDVTGPSVDLVFVRLALRGNVTGRLNYNLTPTIDLPSMSVRLAGPMRTRATGRAWASASVLAASAGVSATLTYADTNAAVDVNAALGNGISGRFDFTVQPIRFRIVAWASLWTPLGTLYGDQTLVDWSDAAQSGSRSF